ncbi:MAG: tetratricopeptide repeat protein [SAR86 cluster bacterium SAR86B]|uniref:Tetratricopeptide repeat protein n=1 Tax=SAR86 cluster bacterium SAR86B TaxID=1123867 RepID=J4KSE8_9GAMM|nr:MAG: tetratricopeptide repeat protein [SAR86 cluster bacterium SAR86B]
MPFVTGLAVKKNLAQCYFQLSNYKDTIRVLEAYIAEAEKRGQLYGPRDLIMLGISYYQNDELEKAYTNIKKANSISNDYKEDWLGYELAIAVKLEKYKEAVEVAQLLVFVNPEKKEYWKQISGLYYTTNDENESLAGLELAFEKNTLTKEKEYLDLARYYLYKELPQKAIKVLEFGINNNIVNGNKKNYELLADSYFFLRDRDIGINYLIKSLEIESDPNTAFKIGRFAFEEENWKLAIKYLKEAKVLNYNKVPGRLDLLIGISLYESNEYSSAISYFNKALEFEETKTPAEGWLAFMNELENS